jgi:hypothetical protein
MIFKSLAGAVENTMHAPVRVDRRVTRMVAGLAAVVTAVLGLSLVAAGPAAAATGSWRAYGNTNPITSSTSHWQCGFTKTVTTNVVAQACAIRSSNGFGVQAAVIVRNNRSSLYAVEAAVELTDWETTNSLGRWECSRSGVGANSWSVCFGQTLSYASRVYTRQGGANGVLLPGSSSV